jgi:HEAT repeat protein
MADDKYSSLRALDAMQVRGLDGKREYVDSLEARGDEQALSLLVECLCDESAFLRDLAEHALERLGARAVEVLLPHLTQGLWFTRASVARVLGRLSAREALPGLLEMAGDANRSVAEAAREGFVRVAAGGHAVSAARALYRGPAPVRQAVLALAGRTEKDLAAQLVRVLADDQLMTAGEDEVLSEDATLAEPHEGVEWELLTGRGRSEPARPRERPDAEAEPGP